MDVMELGKIALLLGAVLVGISGIAFVLWNYSSRYAETMAAFNDRLRMQYIGRLFRIGGSTLALGGVGLLLVVVLQREPRSYQLGVDPRTDAAVVTPAEEGSRRLNELTANVRILSDSQREVSAAFTKSKNPSLTCQLAACRRTVRRLTRQAAVRPDFTIPTVPPRPARVALDEGLSRGDPGGSD
ncbi:hypothetical protein HYW67_04000 [Candidatus Parcubacteria bacterium]|nr:hypothetical protein [Candidatus Parcubacteria bacterium]